MLNRTTFFAYARRAPFGGKLSSAQVSGMTAILDAWDRLRITDPRWLAYALATTLHETAGTMQPIREAHGKTDAQSIARLDAEWAKPGHGALKAVRAPYWRTGYFGRGFVQLTHEENYRKAGDMVGVDLVANPGRAMEPKIAAEILLCGMVRGIFRKSKDGWPETLDRYFGPLPGDPVGARAIINGGGDKANLIASYYKAFKDALAAGSELTPQPADVDPVAAEPDDVPVTRSGSAGAVAVSTGAAAGASLVAAIQSPWALAAFALILIAGGVGLWLAATGRLAILRGRAPV
ncbi:glycoside hydrolase family 19 protein [Bosea sp. (in: a-proteobacteria)]|uniref:glycoside hydrolase family 19 protein n=1 Tax=Bosea sp. (in: a-proteobacteria) TaxID=1871050 RepID=UPI002629B661|nr:glycoside hydrolase family 19 protein [Bosea sp. (in: a-proteobacteria)]MCO5092005.1 hypothetical protein [Bosea sp. (in: a-proteobacteria)]